MQADIHLLLLGRGRGVAFRPHVEADDDRVRRRGQQHVAFVDGAHAGVDHADLDLVVGELLQGLGEHFGRAAHVGLDDDRQFLDFAGLHLLVQLLQGEAAGFGERGFLLPLIAEIDDLLGLGGIGDHLEIVAGFGQRIETEHFDRRGGLGLADLRAAIVLHGAHLAEDRAADEEIADGERAVAHQHGGHGTASAIQLGFDDGAHGGTAGVGLEVLHVGHQQNHFEQQVEILLGAGRNRHHDDVAAPVFGEQAAIGRAAA